MATAAATTTTGAGPSAQGPAHNRGFSSKGGSYQKKTQRFGTPLPILLPTSPLHPNYNPNQAKQGPTFLQSFAISLGHSRAIVPQCRGVFDKASRSVFVEDRQDMEILFTRGFFGKGTLSRSEPTWRQRRIAAVKGGDECE